MLFTFYINDLPVFVLSSTLHLFARLLFANDAKSLKSLNAHI